MTTLSCVWPFTFVSDSEVSIIKTRLTNLLINPYNLSNQSISETEYGIENHVLFNKAIESIGYTHKKQVGETYTRYYDPYNKTITNYTNRINKWRKRYILLL